MAASVATYATACTAVAANIGCCGAESTGALCYKTERGVESIADEGNAAPAGSSYICPALLAVS